MILRHEHLAARPKVFASMTGLTPALFDDLAAGLAPRLAEARLAPRRRLGRRRAPGAGPSFELAPADALLLTVVWLRHYPTLDVLGYLFGVSKATASRMIASALPLLEAAGRDTMRLPDPGRYRRRSLAAVLDRVPALAALPARAAAGLPPHGARGPGPGPPAVLVDSFEQAVQRPRRRAEADRWYSGKKRMHTIKTQVAVCEATGYVVDLCGDAVGPFSDVTLLAASGLDSAAAARGELEADRRRRLRRDGRVPRPGAWAKISAGEAFHARRPLDGGRPAVEPGAAAGRRVGAEHGIRRLRVYQCLSHRDRHHRRGHERRVVAVAGLVNRRLPVGAADEAMSHEHLRGVRGYRGLAPYYGTYLVPAPYED